MTLSEFWRIFHLIFFLSVSLDNCQSMQERMILPSILDFQLPDEVKSLFNAHESHFRFGLDQHPIAKSNLSVNNKSVSSTIDETQQRNIRGWTLEEDNLLRNAVAQFPHGSVRWEVVAKSVSRRNMKQCRERWEFHLNPEISKEPFTQYEDRVIVAQQKKIGNRWTLIAEQLPGRTSSSVKNRWYTVLKRLSPKEVNQLLNGYHGMIQMQINNNNNNNNNLVSRK